MTNDLYQRQTALIETNATWLRQASALLGKVTHHAYASIGGHLRHILEFYECFLDGVDSGHIDYDARKRDQLIERSRTAAAGRIYSLVERLQNTAALRGDATNFIRIDAVMHRRDVRRRKPEVGNRALAAVLRDRDHAIGPADGVPNRDAGVQMRHRSRYRGESAAAGIDGVGGEGFRWEGVVAVRSQSRNPD